VPRLTAAEKARVTFPGGKRTLYFVAQRPDSAGGLDIYRSKRYSGQYDEPRNLGRVINSPQAENDVYIAPDESFIIFSSGRSGGLGENDFISVC